MERGHVVDYAHGGRVLPEWSAGEPQWSIIGVMSTGPVPAPLAAFRCRACGMLEWYARHEYAIR